MDAYRYDDMPPAGMVTSVVLQAAFIALINCSFLIVIFKAAHLTDARLVTHQQWLMIAYFFTNFIQCLRFSKIGAGLFLPATSPAIYLAPALLAASMGGLPLMVGMMIFSGVCELIFSFIIRPLRALFPPEISGLAFLIIGIQLCSVAFQLSIASHPSLGRIVFLFIILAIIVSFSVWAKGIVKNLCPLYGAIVGLILLYFFPDFFHYAWKSFNLSAFSWVSYPSTTSFWPINITFKWGLIPVFLLTAFVATIRTVGVAVVSYKYETASTRPNYSFLKRAIRGDAISSIFSSFTCGLGMNVAPITTTLTIASKCTSRYVPLGVGFLFFILAFSPKLMSFLTLTPDVLIGVMMMWYGVLLIGSGLIIMDSKQFNIQQIFSVGFGLLVAITILIYPGVYEELPTYLITIVKQPLTSGLVLAFVLTLLFQIKRKKYFFRFKNNPEKPELIKKSVSTFFNMTDIPDKQKNYIYQCLHDSIKKINDTLAESDITVDISCDKRTLDVNLTYQGELLTLQKYADKKLFSLFDEQLVSAGLVSYFNVLPDTFHQKKEGTLCTLNFEFFLD